MPIYIHRNRWRNSKSHLLILATSAYDSQRKLTASCDVDVTMLAIRWCNVHGLVRAGSAFHDVAFGFARESLVVEFSLKTLKISVAKSLKHVRKLTHWLHWCLSLWLAFSRLNSFLLHCQRPGDVVKLVVESTRVTYRLSLAVTAPQCCRCRITIVTA